jgi:hypothetical protein
MSEPATAGASNEALRLVLPERAWAPSVPFKARLVALERALQAFVDRLPSAPFTRRVPVSVRLTLDDLAVILPPTEQRLLTHLRARRPLRDLDGTPGFHTRSRRNERLQRLLSRIQTYCGSAVRYRLMQPYDRPGHPHRLCPGPRRRLASSACFEPLRLWVPPAFLRTHPSWSVSLEGKLAPSDLASRRRRASMVHAPPHDHRERLPPPQRASLLTGLPSGKRPLRRG